MPRNNNEVTFTVSLDIGERGLGALMAEATRQGAWGFNFAVSKVPKSRKTKDDTQSASKMLLEWIRAAGAEGLSHKVGKARYVEAGFRPGGYYAAVTKHVNDKLVRSKDSVSYITQRGMNANGEA